MTAYDLMRKHLLLPVLAIFASCLTVRSQCPEEWLQYTAPDFLYGIQSGQNDTGMDENAFCNYLLDLARAELAKSVMVSVSDRAELSRRSTDGRTSVDYSSVTTFSTDIELSLVKTESSYDRKTKTGRAIAYIFKPEALDFYRNRLRLAFDGIEASLSSAGRYYSEGLAARAAETLEELGAGMEGVREDLSMLNFFGATENELSELSGTARSYMERAAGLEAMLNRGTVLCLECSSAEVDCGDFEKVLKGLLSEKKFSFTDCPDEADWSVSVDIDTREYGVSEIGGMKIYTVYAEASLTMRKIIGTQKTLEDRVSAKGVHTVGYEEALRDAFDKLGDTLAERLYSIINQ